MHRRISRSISIGMMIAALTAPSSARADSGVERVSVTTDGSESAGNNYSFQPSISADGRYVLFTSQADDLVPGDTNGVSDVFLRDRVEQTTIRVSLSNAGGQANGSSFSGADALSADGRFAVLMSYASNLVSGDTNQLSDIFVRDLVEGGTLRVSVASDGRQQNGQSQPWFPSFHFPVISADGRVVSFHSNATKLVADDTGYVMDVFVHDLGTHATERVSTASGGAEGDRGGLTSKLSSDGRYVAFMSHSTNLVLGDTNESADIFVKDRVTGTTERVNVSNEGLQALTLPLGHLQTWMQPQYCVSPMPCGFRYAWDPEFAISPDGSLVAFGSWAPNLVLGDLDLDWDVFVRDRIHGTTTRVSLPPDGSEPNRDCVGALSFAGTRKLAFVCDATNLVAGDSNQARDVFLADLSSGQISMAALNDEGLPGNQRSTGGALTPDGRLVAFASLASNLVADDTNGMMDIFVRALD